MLATPTSTQGNWKKNDIINKTELQQEVKIHRKNEAQKKEKIPNLRKETNEIKEGLKELSILKERYNPQENNNDRIIFIEKRPTKQKQHARRETIELMGLANNINNGELKEALLQTLEETEVKVTKEVFIQYTDYETKKW